jgi:hypothetical protein
MRIECRPDQLWAAYPYGDNYAVLVCHGDVGIAWIEVAREVMHSLPLDVRQRLKLPERRIVL